MRTTIEIKLEHRAKLLELAARRGSKGFSELVAEALDVYLELEVDRATQRKRAALLKGALHAKETEDLRNTAAALRSTRR